jgi:hypothetical protein
MSQNINNITDGVATTNIQDFRAKINQSANSVIFPNAWKKEQSTDYRFFVNKKDKLNQLYPFVFKNDVAPWEINDGKTDDLIKFVFEAISNDDPSYSTAIFFRAFLTAGITDNNSAQWNAFKYMGRGENFYVYQGFDRSVSFSFRVYAGSKEELKPMYNRVNNLVSQVYPDYSPNQGIMRAPIVRLTIGDYFYRVPGFLESVNITVDNNYPWEINLEKSQTGDIAQLPQVIDISISFKPVFDILPKRSSVGDIRSTTSTFRDPVNVDTEITTNEEIAQSNSTALIANIPQDFIRRVDANRTAFSVTENSISERRAVEEANEQAILEERQRQDLQSFTTTTPGIRI